MNCALWLNHRKVYAAADISDNIDLASLCGYFTAGSLIKWLKAHGGEDYAAELEKISPNDPMLKDKIGKVFGGKTIPYKSFGNEVLDIGRSGGFLPGNSFAAAASSGKTSSYGSGFPRWKLKLMGSFGFSSYSYTSYLLKIGFGSARAGSYFYSSGTFGFEWEWEWERFLSGYGSFYTASFGYGSFLAALREFFVKNYGSWNYGSAFSRYFGSFNGGIMPQNGFGSYVMPDSDEYDRIIMECVFGCPLNGYGYGIHNI